MKVLITGGFGFVGHTLVRQLLASGAEVHVLDNMQGVSPLAKDLIHCVAHYAHDITDAAAVTACLHQVKPDTCIHLAAIHYIPACEKNPVSAYNTNVLGTINLIEACAQAHVSHFFFMSTGAIYIDSDEALDETQTAIQPSDIYGLTKWIGEQTVQIYSKRNPASMYSIGRLFNVYGPGETNPHVIPEILNQLRTSNHLDLGNISAKRDYVHVTDVAQAVIRLCKQPFQPGIHTYHICQGEAYAVSDVIELIRMHTGRPITVHSNPSKFRASDKQVQLGSNTNLTSLMQGYRFRSMQEGLYELLTQEGLIK